MLPHVVKILTPAQLKNELVLNRQRVSSRNAGQYLGPMGALYQRLDAFDQFVSGVDIDARIAIG